MQMRIIINDKKEGLTEMQEVAIELEERKRNANRLNLNIRGERANNKG
jgi:hypothetical protein